LTNLLVIESVPAWTSNRLKRLVLRPKRYVVDPSLIGAILQLDTNAVLRDGDLLGRVIDTFVVAQLRAELTVGARRPRLYHLRGEQGRQELDLIAELGATEVVAFEVKATAAPHRESARHLAWFRDELRERFLAGVVFHTGPRTFSLGERIVAAPIATLWP
jgi:hypothetical protein